MPPMPLRNIAAPRTAGSADARLSDATAAGRRIATGRPIPPDPPQGPTRRTPMTAPPAPDADTSGNGGVSAFLQHCIVLLSVSARATDADATGPQAVPPQADAAAYRIARGGFPLFPCLSRMASCS